MNHAQAPSPCVLVVQHVADEGLGLFEAPMRARGAVVEVVGPDASLDASTLARADGLVVLGGPMGVYEADRHPRLRGEIAWLEAALTSRTPVLGICLGSQLLARALGAKVSRAPEKEIGWREVELSPEAREDALFSGAPERFHALHWHGDVFDLPHGATHLAKSALTAHQAFAYEGLAWGLLFHLEAGPAEVRAMADAFPEELEEAGVSRAQIVADAQRLLDATRAIGAQLVERWLDVVTRRPR